MKVYKKYKIKRKKRIIKVRDIMLIFLVNILCISIGYSYWSTNLNIKGSVISIKKNPDLPSEISSNKLTWEIVNSWGTGTSNNPEFYQVKIDIENHDGNISEWELSFEVPEGIIEEKINAWIASSTRVEGNRVYMKCQSWNAVVPDGGILKLEFQLPFSQKVDFHVKDVVFNNKLITLN